ncbi:MAG: hypothetical protein LBT89_09675 [Planctomycetaceae bacterium]|jgi:tetratricopeptide (TPR) repeat protein|nr:hypothetical protein [Planctomycetaceae bacterium]
MLYRLLTAVVFCFLTETLFAGPFAAVNQAEVDYGRGVHAFFAGDYKAALGFFQQVEKSGSNDPRPYYYAGLTYKRIKNKEKSEEYYKKAASLEFGENIKREYDVSDALHRIQGRERLIVEQYREEARAKWQAEEKKRNEVKFNEQKERERQIVESFAKPNPPQDDKVLQALTQPADFGAKPIEPLKPESVSKVLPRKEPVPVKQTAEEEPEEKEAAEENEKPETADKDDDDKDPFSVNKKTAGDNDDGEDPFAAGLKKKRAAESAEEDEEAKEDKKAADKTEKEADEDAEEKPEKSDDKEPDDEKADDKKSDDKEPDDEKADEEEKEEK